MIDGPCAAASQAIPIRIRQPGDEGSVKLVTDRGPTTGNQIITGKLSSGEAFRTLAPADAQVTDRLIQRGVQVQAKEAEQSSFWLILLYNSLPFLLMIGLAFFVMRQMQKNAGSGAMGFGKSRARMLTEKQGRVTFADVAGIDEAREDLQDRRNLKDPRQFARLGGKIPRRLAGRLAGTGKTLLAAPIAARRGALLHHSGSDFVEMFVGVGASRVRDMCSTRPRNRPLCSPFIDGNRRGRAAIAAPALATAMTSASRRSTIWFVEMDGFEANEGIIIIARPHARRARSGAAAPGRFDVRSSSPAPDIDGRDQILAVHMKKVPLAPRRRSAVIARGTPGSRGAISPTSSTKPLCSPRAAGKRLSP